MTPYITKIYFMKSLFMGYLPIFSKFGKITQLKYQVEAISDETFLPEKLT